MSDPVLGVRGLDVSYGKVHALRGVDLEISRGEIVSLLGSNGAGKSSLLNAITGVVAKRGGTVTHRGADISRASPWTLVAAGVVQVPEGRQVFPQLNVQEHLRLAERPSVAGRPSFSASDVYDLFPRLTQRRKVAAGNLSGGEQQMLVIGRALVAQPDVLLLDEPSLGLSPKLAQTVIESVGRLRESGISVLLVEQNAALALGVSDRVYVLANGSIAARGTADEMRSSDDVRRAYLGDHG